MLPILKIKKMKAKMSLLFSLIFLLNISTLPVLAGGNESAQPAVSAKSTPIKLQVRGINNGTESPILDIGVEEVELSKLPASLSHSEQDQIIVIEPSADSHVIAEALENSEMPRKLSRGGENEIIFMNPIDKFKESYGHFLQSEKAYNTLLKIRIGLLGVGFTIVAFNSSEGGAALYSSLLVAWLLSSYAAVYNKSLVHILGHKVTGFDKSKVVGRDIFTGFTYAQEKVFDKTKGQFDWDDSKSGFVPANLKFAMIEFLTVGIVNGLKMLLGDGISASQGVIDFASSWATRTGTHAVPGIAFQGLWSALFSNLDADRKADLKSLRRAGLSKAEYDLGKRANENKSMVEMSIVSLISTILVITGSLTGGQLAGFDTINVLLLGASPALAYVLFKNRKEILTTIKAAPRYIKSRILPVTFSVALAASTGVGQSLNIDKTDSAILLNKISYQKFEFNDVNDGRFSTLQGGLCARLFK